jgi:putative ABC transport system permease protein
MLLIAAGLLVRSYERLTLREPGFEAEGRLRFGVDFPRTLYPSFEGRAAVAREILDRLRAIPGVRSAAASARTPLGGNPWTGTFHPEGFEPGSGAPVPGAELNVVSPDYPQALGMALLRGRGFTLDDDENALPVALVDRWTEERFWPEGATGQRIRVGGELHEVVGVVEHVLYETLDEPGRYQLYFPAFQRDWWRHLDFVIETRGDPASSAPRARAEIARLAPDLAVHSIRTLRGVVQDSLALRRLQTALVGIFGVVVLALASVGIYGVLSHSVGQRKKEIGLRMALGATRKAVLGLALKEGFVLAALGTAAGWIGARLVSRILPSLLYEVAATDLASYLAMTAILCSVILAAALIPAVRAARTDPWTALRSE